MRDPEAGKEIETGAFALVVLGDGEIHMDAGHGRQRLDGRTGEDHTISVAFGKHIERRSPVASRSRCDNDSVRFVHAIMFPFCLPC